MEANRETENSYNLQASANGIKQKTKTLLTVQEHQEFSRAVRRGIKQRTRYLVEGNARFFFGGGDAACGTKQRTKIR